MNNDFKGVGTWTPGPINKNGTETTISDIHYDEDKNETLSYLEYTANLDLPYHKLPVFDETVKCEKRYIVRNCGCGRSIVPSGCMNTKCPSCKSAVGKRRSRKVSNRFFSKHKNITMLYTVFTIPPHLRPKYVNKKEWQSLRKKLWKLLKTQYGGIYALEASHPCGDEDNTVFHPHFNFLWIQGTGFRPYIDVNDLRSRLMKIIGVSQINFKHRYSSKKNQIRHWCKYVTRIFPGCHNWTGPTRWYGKYPKIKKVKEECHCHKCEDKFEFIGFLNPDAVNEYFESVDNRAPPWECDEHIYSFSGRGM